MIVHPARTIGFLTHTDGWGGTELHTVAVARALLSKGYGVVLIELGHKEYSVRREMLGDVGRTIVPVSLPDLIEKTPIRFWADLIRHHRLDTAVLPKGGFGNHWPRLDVAILLSRTRYIGVEHAVPPAPRLRRSQRHLMGLIPGLGLWYWRDRTRIAVHRTASTRVIAVSDAIKRRLVEDYAYRPERIVVIRNGVDATVFRWDRKARDAARARWAVPDSAFVFGTLGRLVPVKRIDRALQAFRTVTTRRPDRPVYLVMVGSGPEEASLQRLAAELELADRCIWAGESESPREDLPGIDAYLLTSESEGHSYSLIEAMACERVCIAVDSGGVGEVLVDGVNGLLTGDSVPEIADAMQAVMSQPPEVRAAIGQRARRDVLQRHNHEKLLAETVSIIETPERGASGSG